MPKSEMETDRINTKRDDYAENANDPTKYTIDWKTASSNDSINLSAASLL